MSVRMTIAFLLAVTLATLAALPARASSRPPVSLYCVEAETGAVVVEEHAHVTRPPASMVKLMLMLLVAEGLDRGDWTHDTEITISRRAHSTTGTQIFLENGQVWDLGRLALALAVASANDAAVAVAEGLWGSVEACLEVMNRRARELGMENTEYHSVHGLPPRGGNREFDMTTAYDMSVLARVAVQHPEIMRWASTRESRFREDQNEFYNTNKLLWRMDDCDGLKTGYISAAGWCLTATAERDGIRLIGVVMGESSNNNRFRTAGALLEDGFSRTSRKLLVARGEPVGQSIPIANASVPAAPLVAGDDLWAIVVEGREETLTLAPELPVALRAPARTGREVGRLHARYAGTVLGSIPLTLADDITVAGWRQRLKSVLRDSAATGSLPAALTPH